ncbi:MAG TPA: VanW family protein [Candidatus Fimivivens sp.]|nr:VanW family protein [Candidatus Fimivivens sp.]
MRQSGRKLFTAMFWVVSFGLFPYTTTPARALSVIADGFSETVPTTTLSTFSTTETVLIPRSLIRSEIEDTDTCDAPMLCLWTVPLRARETTLAVSTARKIDSAAIAKYVSTLPTRVNRAPSDPKFGETPDKAITLLGPAKDGLTLDESAAVPAIRDAIANGAGTVTLPTKTVPPSIDTTDPSELGLTGVVAEATTNFRGSPKNRIFNINRALQQFQGVLIAPDEEFSFVKHLGEVDGDHGYLPELVIKENKTEPEFGGGICQVSTTVFRAAINAGMKITARRNHAYPVSYYKPYGMDATVYVPKPDLRFVNNTPGHILVFSSIEGTALTFRFYGTPDGRQVAIDGPHILESNPDGSMKTTFGQKVTDASGNVIIDDTFASNYKSPSLFPHPQDYTEKPDDWSKKQWKAYLEAKAASAATTAALMATTKPVTTGN